MRRIVYVHQIGFWTWGITINRNFSCRYRFNPGESDPALGDVILTVYFGYRHLNLVLIRAKISETPFQCPQL